MRLFTFLAIVLVGILVADVAHAAPTGTYWTCKQAKHGHLHSSKPGAKHLRKHKCKRTTRNVPTVSQPVGATTTSVTDPRIHEVIAQRQALRTTLANIAGMRLETGESASAEFKRAVDTAYAAVPESAPTPINVLPTVHPFDDRGCIFEPGGCDLITANRNLWRTEAGMLQGLGDAVERAAGEYLRLGTPASLAALNAARDAWRTYRNG